jgi:hypothetical protein
VKDLIRLKSHLIKILLAHTVLCYHFVFRLHKANVVLKMKSQDSSSDSPACKGLPIDEDIEAKDVCWQDGGDDNRALLSYEEEKKLLRRVDWRLVPMCALIFLVKSLDVNNASRAQSCASVGVSYTTN